MILGMVLVFIGVAMLSAPADPRSEGILGWPGAPFGGAAGALARDNARRNPQRTASTAAALMIGLALVTLVATLGGASSQTFTGAVNEIFVGDYAITAQNNFSPIPIDAAEAAAQAPGVQAVGNVRTGETLVFGSTEFSTAVDPGASQGDQASTGSRARDEVFAQLGKDGAFVDKDYAEKHDLEVGSPVEITFANGNTETFTSRDLRPAVRGIAVRRRSPSRPRAWAPRTRIRRTSTRSSSWKAASRCERGGARAALEPFPNAKVATRQEFVDNQIPGLSRPQHPLRPARALDHRQPLWDRQHARAQRLRAHARVGMLRAIGMTRRQTRRMIGTRA